MKKEQVLNELLKYVKSHGFQKGDKLPPERDLSDLLNISRSTVREVLRMLEVRGQVTVKRGSGAYLQRNPESLQLEENMVLPDEKKRIKDYLEARFLFIPMIMEKVFPSLVVEKSTTLRECMVHFSQAIMSGNQQDWSELDGTFHHLLAEMTGNYVLIKMMDQLNAGNEAFWQSFDLNDPFVGRTIFAGYVKIVNCFDQKHFVEAAQLSRGLIQEIYRLLLKTKKVRESRLLEVSVP